MRYFAKVVLRGKDSGKTMRVVFMATSKKARDALLIAWPEAKPCKRSDIPSFLGSLKPFGEEFWGAVETKLIPETVGSEHPSILRVTKCKKGEDAIRIDGQWGTVCNKSNA